MTFQQYLQQQDYSDATIAAYKRYSDRFMTWLQVVSLDAESVTYNDLLSFLQYGQQQGWSKRTMHNLLGVIRHYFLYLITENKRTDNPAAGLYIKGLVRKLPSNLLTMDELEELYTHYHLQLNVDAGKKSMLGLMIYQGLPVAELMRIKREDIKIREGRIILHASARTNGRTLELKAVQLPALQAYLKANRFKEGSLFIEQTRSDASQRNVHNRIKHMFDQLKKLNPKVINAKQIRSSVITEWLRKEHLRQVQYMAGHKYVSSTERYQLSGMEDLQNELLHHHPMK